MKRGRATSGLFAPMTSGSRFEHEPRGIARDRSPPPIARRPVPKAQKAHRQGDDDGGAKSSVGHDASNGRRLCIASESDQFCAQVNLGPPLFGLVSRPACRPFCLIGGSRKVVHHARRILFLQFPRSDRGRTYSAFLRLGRFRNQLVVPACLFRGIDRGLRVRTWLSENKSGRPARSGAAPATGSPSEPVIASTVLCAHPSKKAAPRHGGSWGR
jgi:hypothetical protein